MVRLDSIHVRGEDKCGSPRSVPYPTTRGAREMHSGFNFMLGSVRRIAIALIFILGMSSGDGIQARAGDPELSTKGHAAAQEWRGHLKVVLEVEHADAVASIAWSPDETRVATVDLQRGINMWDVASGRLMFRIEKRDFIGNDLAFMPDGKSLIVKALTNGTVPHAPNLTFLRKPSLSVLDSTSGATVRTIDGPYPNTESSAPRVFTVSPDGIYVVVAPDSPHGHLILFNTSNWVVERSLDVTPNARVMAIASDNRQFAWASGDGGVRLCSLSDLVCSAPLLAFPSDIQALAFSPDSRIIWVATNNAYSGGPGLYGEHQSERKLAKHQMIRAFNVEGHDLIGSVEGEFLTIQGLAAHPDGTMIAITVGNDQVELIDARTLSVAREIRVSHRHTHPIAFSPSGKMLAVGSGRWLTVLTPRHD